MAASASNGWLFYGAFEATLRSIIHFDKGRLTEISAPAKEPRVSFDSRDFYHRESRLFGVDSRVQGVSGCAPSLEALTPGFEAGALLAPSAIESYALEDAVKAYEQVQNRSTSSKVVLTPKR